MIFRLNFQTHYATLRHMLLNKKCSILHADLIQILKIFRKLPRWAWQALKVWKKWLKNKKNHVEFEQAIRREETCIARPNQLIHQDLHKCCMILCIKFINCFWTLCVINFGKVSNFFQNSSIFLPLLDLEDLRCSNMIILVKQNFFEAKQMPLQFFEGVRC